MSGILRETQFAEPSSPRLLVQTSRAFDLADDRLRLRPVQPAELQELDQVDPSFPGLALGDERLRFSEALSRLDLGHASVFTGLLEKPQELLVGGGKGGLS